MNFTRRFAVLCLAVFAMAAVFSGCEASVGTPSDAEQLQRIISEQLPAKVKDQVDNPKVKKVTCVEGSTGKYDCIAKLDFTVKDKPESQDVSISGSCDEKNCIWETKD